MYADICDSAWQSTRDILIILALTFSVSVLLFFVAAALMFMLSCYIDKQGKLKIIVNVVFILCFFCRREAFKGI